MTILHYSTSLKAPLEKVFEWGSNLENLSFIQPGYFKILKGGGIHEKGKKFVILFWEGLLPTLWFGRISDFKQNSHFTDVSDFGLFKHWQHTHSFKALASGATEISDHIEYELRGGFLGRYLDKLYVKSLLDKMYRGRQKKLHQNFEKLNTSIS